jgi:hypothetical protein
MEYMTVVVSKKVRAMTCRNSTTTLPFTLRAVANLPPFKSLEENQTFGYSLLD